MSSSYWRTSAAKFCISTLPIRRRPLGPHDSSSPEAFPYAQTPRYLLRDRDGIYGLEFVQHTLGLDLEQKLIAPRSPWQNPCVQRLVGSIRRECPDHMIVLHEQHLRRRLTDCLRYYHQHRTHRTLDQDAPESRSVEAPEEGNNIALPVLSGLHHRNARQAAA